MKTTSIILLLTALLLTGCGGQAAAPAEQDASAVAQQVTEHSADLFAMDTYMTLKVWSADGGAAVKAASDRIEELENLLSVTNPDSDISRVNQSAGSPTEVSADTVTILQKALEIGDASSGALDISVYPVLKAWGFTTGTMQVPEQAVLKELLSAVDYTRIQLDGNTVTIPADMQIDLGALAKGYTSDSVMQIFRETGAESAIISLGGNVQALGRKQDGSLWKVGILNPFQPSENLCVVQIADKAVITSGNYERYFTAEDGNVYWHIIDRTDGYPADNGLVSVTVIGESGLTCDALSTALFVEGTEKAVEHWKNSSGFEVVLVTDEKQILVSEGLQDTFQNVSSFPVEVITRE